VAGRRAAGRSPHRDDQWLLGEDLVVAPELRQGAVRREAWLPPGRWQWQGAGPAVEGARVVEVEAPLEVLPYWTRHGTSPLAAAPGG